MEDVMTGALATVPLQATFFVVAPVADTATFSAATAPNANPVFIRT